MSAWRWCRRRSRSSSPSSSSRSAISFALAFRAKDGSFTLQHFEKSFELYTTDLLFSLAIVLLSSALIAVVAIAIAATSRSARTRGW
jgi:ABC-type uncharacterized transport system permease subunit